MVPIMATHWFHWLSDKPVILFQLRRFRAWGVKQVTLPSRLYILIIRKGVVHGDAMACQITTCKQYVHTHRAVQKTVRAVNLKKSIMSTVWQRY